METWMNLKGKGFLKDIGLKEDDFLLDFGCGHGNYTIPSSHLVGKNGRVYSVDKNKQPLDNLKLRIRGKKLNNIEIMQIEDYANLPFSDRHLDFILLYDVFHLIDDRKKLLLEMHRILKNKGVMSIYPKHHDTEMNMSLDEVINEIESNYFILDKKISKKLIHDDKIEDGIVLNFKKKIHISKFF